MEFQVLFPESSAFKFCKATLIVTNTEGLDVLDVLYAARIALHNPEWKACFPATPNIPEKQSDIESDRINIANVTAILESTGLRLKSISKP